MKMKSKKICAHAFSTPSTHGTPAILVSKQYALLNVDGLNEFPIAISMFNVAENSCDENENPFGRFQAARECVCVCVCACVCLLSGTWKLSALNVYWNDKKCFTFRRSCYDKRPDFFPLLPSIGCCNVICVFGRKLSKLHVDMLRPARHRWQKKRGNEWKLALKFGDFSSASCRKCRKVIDIDIRQILTDRLRKFQGERFERQQNKISESSISTIEKSIATSYILCDRTAYSNSISTFHAQNIFA